VHAKLKEMNPANLNRSKNKPGNQNQKSKQTLLGNQKATKTEYKTSHIKKPVIVGGESKRVLKIKWQLQRSQPSNW
jgi:hypothetical protein